MNILRSIDKVLARIECWLIILSLSLMVVLTFIHIILRNIYMHAHFQWANSLLGQIDWTEPFVRMLVLWVTFLGASLLTSDNKHIRIDLMPSLLPPEWLNLREILLSMACVLISILMLKSSIDYIRIDIAFGGRMFLGLPAWIGQLVIPAGFSVILFRFLIRTIEQFLVRIRGSMP